MSEPFTAAEKYKEAIREVEKRRVVYARAVEAGTMRKHKAERLIAIMMAIAADYQVQAEAEIKRGKLPFGVAENMRRIEGGE